MNLITSETSSSEEEEAYKESKNKLEKAGLRRTATPNFSNDGKSS